MTDIAKERMWLRQHGARQRLATAEAETQRWADEVAREAKNCPYCFHDRHDDHFVGELIVQNCRTRGCVCGVPPCETCGRREGRTFNDERGIEECVCGETWLATAMA